MGRRSPSHRRIRWLLNNVRIHLASRGGEKAIPLESEVTIIGAGPAGARCAALLASAGHDVLLVEKDAFAGETSVCGGALDASFAVELSLPKSIVKEISRQVFHFGSKAVEIETRKISFARSKFDRFLAERAVSEGAKLLSSTRAISATRDSKGVAILTLNRKSGESNVVRSRIAIFADGPSTLARELFGIGFHGTLTNMAIGTIYEFDHDGSGDSYELFFENSISPWGYGWIFPKLDHLNVGVMCLTAAMDKRGREYLDHFVHEHPAGSRRLKGRKTLRFAAAAIPLAQSRSISCDRVLVVGDAAGMVDSIFGAGIDHGLRGAECAAKVAAGALAQERFDAEYMAGYDALWKRTRDYSTLRRLEVLSNVALHLQTIWPSVYEHLVSFGVTHTSLQHAFHK
jgi:geranylgeranyl reductase family protein